MLLRDFMVCSRFGLYDHIDYCDYTPPEKQIESVSSITNAQFWDFVMPLWEDTGEIPEEIGIVAKSPEDAERKFKELMEKLND